VDFTKRDHAGASLPAASPRLKAHYEQTVRAALATQFGFTNPHEIPTLTKIVINCGVGEAVKQPKLLDVVVEGPNGERAHRDVVRHPGGVGILALDGTDALLVRQYRVAVGMPILEIPAGKLDGVDEPIEVAAIRELEEEIGYTPTELVPLGPMWPSPGYTDEVIHLFAGRALRATPRRPDGVEEHHSEIVRIDFVELVAMVERGEIPDAKTQLAVLAWARRVT
jgi:8-oxo-dGTP pyrophosphatase MutT (NUDIX family)